MHLANKDSEKAAACFEKACPGPCSTLVAGNRSPAEMIDALSAAHDASLIVLSRVTVPCAVSLTRYSTGALPMWTLLRHLVPSMPLPPDLAAKRRFHILCRPLPSPHAAKGGGSADTFPNSTHASTHLPSHVLSATLIIVPPAPRSPGTGTFEAGDRDARIGYSCMARACKAAGETERASSCVS